MPVWNVSKRLVQHLGLADRAPAAEITVMSHDRVGEDVVSVVLAVLVAVAPARRGRVKQRQAKRMVVGLVPAVLAVVEHRNAVAAVLGRQVSPLLCVDLIGRIGIVSAGHGAHAQVVRLRVIIISSGCWRIHINSMLV